MEANEIREVIQLYFDACFESDSEKIARVFHQPAHIYGHRDGSLNDMDRDFFVKLVGTPRPAGAAAPAPRQDEILSIDFTGENTAVARVKLRLGNTLFTDILCFMRLDGKWGVISKVFSGETVV